MSRKNLLKALGLEYYLLQPTLALLTWRNLVRQGQIMDLDFCERLLYPNQIAIRIGHIEA